MAAIFDQVQKRCFGRGVPEALIDAAAMLRGASLRVTRPRLAVLDVLARSPHADTDTVTTLAREVAGPISRQAVYDVLRALADAGLVRRIEPAGSVGRYELRVGDNHHHVVCRRCGAIDDVDGALGQTECLEPPAVPGFVVDQTEVIYWGLCADCRSTAAATTAPSPNVPN